MNMMRAEYIEINLVAMAMLFTMLFFIVRMHPDTEKTSQRYFIKLLICNLIILAADVTIFLLRGQRNSVLYVINHLVCCVYFCLHTYFGYLWLRYCIRKLFPEHRPDRIHRFFYFFPCAAASFFVLLSPWTGWVYSLTQDNRYLRGPYIWQTMAVSYLYWGVSTAIVIYERICQKRIREATLYITLLVFPIPTFVGTIFQMRHYGLSIIWISSAVSLLILFLYVQNNQISRDMLTGLFNRRQTDKHLSWEITHLSSYDTILFLIMIDVDRFKYINDKFGHVTGDQALIQVAKLLKAGCREKDFIGRFGGDEFIIIGRVSCQEEIDTLIQNIHLTMELYNEKKENPYELTVSTGFAVYNKKVKMTMDHFISMADQEMYKMKLLKSENREKREAYK